MHDERDRSNYLAFKEDPENVFLEIRNIVSQFIGDDKCDFLEKVFQDTEKLYRGEFMGYRASNTNYHDLEHTLSVALATARLIHGGHLEGLEFSSKNIVLALIAALFHDTGLIQTREDVEGSGAKYTVGHEERSIVFMKQYLSDKEFSADDLDNCSHFIRCTILSLPPEEIPFASEETEILGKIVGSADLLAQMADRIYLEKLLLLYKEFEEARLPEYDSEVELLQSTEGFHRYISKKRLSEELGGVSAFMRTHLKERWGLDKDLYDESIQKNIQYLKSLKEKCKGSLSCYLENLRRGGISDKIKDQLKKREKNNN